MHYMQTCLSILLALDHISVVVDTPAVDSPLSVFKIPDLQRPFPPAPQLSHSARQAIARHGSREREPCCLELRNASSFPA